MIYLNHAGSAFPRAPGVAAAMQEALLAPPAEHPARFAAAHAAIAAAFALPAPERLLLAPSCTAALAVLLGDLPWQPGDELVTSSLEHHALARPVQKLVAERGVVHFAAPRAPDGPIDLDAVAAQLRGGRVRLVAATGACNVTGEVLPIAELAALAHRHGALCLLDAAQTAGVLPVDVGALGVDLLAFAGHKGLLGPVGIAGLWAAPAVRFACPGASCEVGGGRAQARWSPYPGFCDLGSVNLPAAAGLAAAIGWLGAQPAAVRARPVALAAQLRAAVRERPRVRVLGGGGPHTGAIGMLVEGLPLGAAEAHFAAHGLLVRAGQHCAPLALAALGAPEGCVRVSFGPGNTEADVAAVVAALDAR